MSYNQISNTDTNNPSNVMKGAHPYIDQKQEEALNSDEQDNFDDFAIDEDLLEKDPSYHPTTMSTRGRLEDVRRKNWFGRNFRPVSTGGIRSSAFTLITGTVGAGILGLPSISTYFGLAMSIFFVIFFGLITMWSYFILNDAIIACNRRGYVNLCAYYFGKKGGYIVVFIFIICQLFATIVYCVIAWNFIENILDSFHIYDFVKHADKDGNMIIDNYESGNWLMRVYCVVPLAFVMIPLV